MSLGNNNPKDGTKNLKSFTQMTAEEQRKIALAGSEASIKSRQRTGSMLEAAKLLTKMKVADTETAKNLIEKFNLDENATNAVVLTASVINKGIEYGDPKHAAYIRDTIGEMPTVKTANLNLETGRNNKELIAELFGDRAEEE